MITDTVIIRQKGCLEYITAWKEMQSFTHQRDEKTVDEVWIVEHPPVFTQGQNGKAEHLINPGNIPVVQTDRGGQITYHGPGQIIFYILIDLKRKKFNIREIVTHLEQSVIQFLQDFNIKAYAECSAPGVYINQKKICSIGLRIRRGATFHGLAFNAMMDLEPFSRIYPCGFKTLQMTQLAEFFQPIHLEEIRLKLVDYLMKNLGYNHPIIELEQTYGTTQSK